MLKLSVITINFNNSDGLGKTIESVFQQNFTDYEYIIIDGGSTDGSVDVIKKYSENISYWISEKDKGIYHAMNKGIAIANGMYCLFLNSGDTLVNETVLQNVFNQKPTADIVYGNKQTREVNGSVIHRTMPDKIGVVQLYADTLWHPVSFIKRELFIKYGGYDEHFKIAGDYEFFVRVIISNKVSTKHLQLEIASFDMNGVSSDKKNREKLMAERRAAQDKYMNPVLLFLFRIYSKLRS